MKKAAIGILAHVDAGKTTLAESILFVSGTIRKQGSVDGADTTLDTHGLEKARGITIFTGQAHFKWKNTYAALLDTPGHVDFAAEAERVIRVLDAAILVVSGIDGVEAHTRTLMGLCDTYNVPTFIFVTKTDYARFSRDELMDELKNEFGNCVYCDPETGFESEAENIAATSEEAMEEYFSHGNISDETVANEISKREIFPCFFGSGLKNIGVDTLLDALDKYIKPCKQADVFGAKVFKISRDKNNRITHIKITGGTLRTRDSVFCDGIEEKVAQIRVYNGTKFENANEASAGEVVCVTGLTQTCVGMGLGTEKDDEEPYLEPVMRYRIKLSGAPDAKSVYLKIKSLDEEEPLLRLGWNERLSEIYADIMGEVQTEILRELLKERFGIECEIDRGRVVYKETIDDTVEGVGHYEPLRHYSEVHLRLEPLPRGDGLVFASECTVNELDTNWQRLILTNLQEKTHIGVLTGSPITDMKITLTAGRAHIKHTEGGDFRQSTYRAVRQGLMQAKSHLLEPYYAYTIDVPPEQSGRTMGDIRQMCGSYTDPEFLQSGLVRIKGRVPVSTSNGYAITLASYTAGRGKLSLVFDGYGDCHNADEVTEEYAYDPTADLENSPDSIFCAHGAGFPVKWNEVKNYMHIK